ncbi:histidine phosphatase family protein [Phreatobacter oligotrophus]|uniref:Histidine phosphatase superfamily protein (Branch 1) n=1 Tax=Phreatobacter oligotrophus TaxID=1122261 RepID=A0A2T4YYA4_9HYPH|nr:histidine phosphatase family protein [Phreatobacter oligotrophus]PTM51725.1 histidine phosphatase superfamily protein (branch 1) [Phreatobacter oligotrophus]
MAARAIDRRIFAGLLAAALVSPAVPAMADEARAWAVLASGGIVLFRHANAPGGGDPPGMRIGDCASQRNLDAAGREQARRIGLAFTTRGISVGSVLTSQWCRTRDTAALAFPGRATDAPAFNSFFSDRGRGDAQTAAAREILAGWSGPGALVAVTHQVNITALTGIFPASGEGIVLERRGGSFAVAGRIRP